MTTPSLRHFFDRTRLLAWPAWLRMLAALPVIGLLWALVFWANGAPRPW